MKKIVFILALFIVAVLYGCKSSELEKTETKLQNQGVQAGEGLPIEVRSLSDIQITACETANKAGTCDTRLAELGIVLKEECCEVLSRCC